MNKTMRSLLSSVLALALIFSAFGIIVSADTAKATLSIEETETNLTSGENTVYKLEFKVTTPADSAKIVSAAVAFSYDSTAIAPVDLTYNNVELTATEMTQYGSGAFTHYSGEIIPESGGRPTPFSWTAPGTLAAIVNEDDRVSLNFQSNGKGEAQYVDATSGFVFATFYYVIKDESKMSNDTFKLETDNSTGSALDQFYPTKDKAAAVLLGCQDGSYFRYAPFADGVEETIEDPAWSYTGYVAPSEDIEVSIAGISIEGAKEVKLPDALALTLAGVPTGVNAEIQYKVNDAWVTVAPTEVGAYDVKVVATAQDGYVITDAEAAPTAKVTILAADPVEETKDLDLDAEGNEYTVEETLTTKDGKMTFKDLFVVNAKVAHGLTNAAIKLIGVKFANKATSEIGAVVEFAPAAGNLVVEGEITFKAGVIGVPGGIEVVATPYVVYNK